MIAPTVKDPATDGNKLAAVSLFYAVSKPEEMETVNQVIISLINRKGQ